MFFQNVNLNEMVMCLEDLINYFCQPEEDMGKFFVLLKKPIFLITKLCISVPQNMKKNKTSYVP